MKGKHQWRQIDNDPAGSGSGPHPDASKTGCFVPRTQEAAAYIRDMAADLRDLADTAQLPLLAYLLDMARAEANSLLK